jgi:hypothetical protein
MSIARLSRASQRQLGQYLTPPATAAAIIDSLEISKDHIVLEPCLGEGAFVFALVDTLSRQLTQAELRTWIQSNFYGCEIDPSAYAAFSAAWKQRGLGALPRNVECGDFLRWLPPGQDRAVALNRKCYAAAPLEFFDLIVGNPPFGGSIDPAIQDHLDAVLGFRDGLKIKKETYAFFILKCLDLLKPGGRLCFICSDTLLTIPTMRGLRNWLQRTCEVTISSLPGRFDASSQEMLLLTLTKVGRPASHLTIRGQRTSVADIEATRNLSWRVNGEYARYFSGQTLSDRMVASSGMTIGKNALFLRRISGGVIQEPYDFSFAEEPITLQRELERARLGQLSPILRARIQAREMAGETRRVVVAAPQTVPASVPIPHDDYRFYNKATPRIVYAPPQWAIFWRDDGAYVYTFKKSGNWYLHGVGGKPYFGREGLTWALIAPRLRTRYLPPGYILDSGAPCAFLRPGVPYDELFFIMGWTLTDLCNDILKNVINHTRNIQSKDFERLPYPVWVAASDRAAAISHVKQLLDAARRGKQVDPQSPEITALNAWYAYRESPNMVVLPHGVKR